MKRCLLIAGLLVGSLPFSARSATLVVDPTTSPIRLDGRSDDPAWQQATRLAPFRKLGDITRVSTLTNEARVAIHDGYLYLSGQFEEPEPATLRALQTDTLAIHDDDCAEIFLSTDRVAYSHILVNAAGAKYWDWKLDGRPGPTWFPAAPQIFQGDWDARAVLVARGWSWEFRVRINDLFERPVGGPCVIYLNVTRHRPRGDEPDTSWVPLAGASFHVPREFLPLKLRLPPATERDALFVPRGVFTQRLTAPELPIVGRPVSLRPTNGLFRLPAACTCEDHAGLPTEVKEELVADLAVGRAPPATVALTIGDPAPEPFWSAEQRQRLAGPEAFRLTLAEGRAEIIGRTRAGALRGIATLRLLARRARLTREAVLPALELVDAPRLPYRGWMLHASDPISGVKRNLDALFLLRMNQVVIDLSSHGAPTGFPFESLAIGRTDRTRQDWVGIFDYARAHGIEPIPYVHSWSRVQYLRHAPDTARWYVEDQGSERYPQHRSLDVARPETHAVMLALQQEIVELLHPQEFHIAMDEVHFSRTVSSPAAIARGWKPSDWYVEAITVNDRFFKARGVPRMAIWGDMIDPGQNGRHLDTNGLALLARLPQDVTIYDWKYEGKFDFATAFPSIAFFKQAGFRTIGCPWFRPNNVARVVHSVAAAGADGVLLTAWGDTNLERLAPELVRAAGLAGYLSWSPEDADLSRFPFVADTLLQSAVYWTAMPPPCGPARSLTAPADLLTGGAALMAHLGLPAPLDPAFLATPFRDPRGVTVTPFLRDGLPAALCVTGTGTGFRNHDFARGLAGWVVPSPGSDGRIEMQEQLLTIMRGSNTLPLRAYKDLPLDAARHYRVRYRARAASDGGQATVTAFPGDSAFRFDNAAAINRTIRERVWSDGEIVLPERTASVRLALSARGAGATAQFERIDLIAGDNAGRAPPTPLSLPVAARAKVLTFLHATSPQPILDDYKRMAAQFGAADPGSYRVFYADGTTTTIPLDYRETVTAVNDTVMGRTCGVGLFGTVGGAFFVNLPTLAWRNPHPEKEIARIDLLPGSSPEIALLLFGVAIE